MANTASMLETLSSQLDSDGNGQMADDLTKLGGKLLGGFFGK